MSTPTATIGRWSPSAEPGGTTRAARVAAITQLQQLERILFDGEGRPRARLGAARAERLLQEVNRLRRQLGWLCVDRQHRHCWPDDDAGCPEPGGTAAEV